MHPIPDAATAVDLARYEGSAMASKLVISGPECAGELAKGAEQAFSLFGRVEAACTRFDPESPLMKANRTPERWHRVPAVLVDALSEARCAHLMTAGRFDPRVHDSLVNLGYEHSFTADGGPSNEGRNQVEAVTGRWQPRIRRRSRLVHLDGRRIDLGGIGKGLAVRWAAEVLHRSSRDFLIEAGGDCYASGGPGPNLSWRIGVESPDPEATGPIAVLEVRDLGVATSSTRVRRWVRNGEPVHHLIDPRTGRPGDESVRSVTVVHPDPALAEVWSKSAFLAGAEGISAYVADLALPALWTEASGAVRWSAPMDRFVIWPR